MTVKRVQTKILTFIQQLIGTILAYVDDPDPEGGYQVHQKVKVVWHDVGWLPSLSLACALGVLLVAYADTASRYGKTDVDIFFWLGLLLIFMPAAVRLISPFPSRFERIGLLCLIGCCLYLMKIISSPLYFSAHDEFLHLRTAEDIARSGHLFAKNSLLPVSPHYPGLELITNALSSMSGISIFWAGLIVIGVARIVMVLSIFLLSEQLSASSRQASIATAIYMSNPHFLRFDALYSYESLALPLATFAIFALTYQKTSSHRYQMMLIIGIVLTAIAFIHHVTDYVLDSLLICWSVMYLFRRHAPIRQTNPVGAALFGVCIAIASVVLFSNPVLEYISSFSGGALSELGNILIHENSARHLFADYAGQLTPLWERVFMFSSLLLIVLCLPFGLVDLWLRYRHHALVCIFGIASLLYPVSQLFRLTKSGSEISDRSAAFLFLPISFILAIFIVQFFPVRRLNWLRSSLLCCAMSILFLGGTILGIGPPWELLPGGPYLVEADDHSIQPQGIEAALWAQASIGPNNRIATDRVNRLLMSTYGYQDVVTHIQDHLDVTPIFFASKLGPVERELLQRARLQYLVVDLRLSKALPRFGFYFEQGELGSFQRTVPINQEALTKFRNNLLINQIFDSGDIGIYDVGDFVNAYKKH